MRDNTLRVGSRQSLLAQWQAESVMALLRHYHPELALTWCGIRTQGDRQLDQPLADLARSSLEKGVFVRELETALLQGDIDVAVHSLKDMPGDCPDGLVLHSAGPREDPRDALVAAPGHTLATLPPGARVGTSSVRRVAMLARLRPDLVCCPVRGNLQTRLAKLAAGDYDALILAAAGLRRVGEAQRIAQYLDPLTEMVPPCGQGILAVEFREDDDRVRSLLAAIALPQVEAAMTAERAALITLQAGCSVPLGAYAASAGADALTLSLWWLPPNADTPQTAQACFEPAEAARTGARLAQRLMVP